MPAKIRSADDKTSFDSYVVGIGASAGGLEAINEFFENTPPDSSFCYILVQHLSPDYKSLMPELLARHTPMKIYEAEHNVKLRPNSVFLLPSKSFMTLKGDRLQ